MKNWKDRPVTWGGYMKLSAVAFVVSFIGAIISWLAWDDGAREEAVSSIKSIKAKITGK